MSGSANKQLLLIHGRGPKPGAAELEALWRETLRRGMARDRPKQSADFDALSISFLYYGDLLVDHAPADYNPDEDLVDRKYALSQLSDLGRSKDFRRRYYDALPGKTPLKELLFDAGAALGLGGLLEQRYVPELAGYVAGSAPWKPALMARTDRWLGDALDSGSQVLVLSHCLGSVAVFDALWRYSQSQRALSAAASLTDRVRCDLVTLGSPLSAASVQKGLEMFPLTPAVQHPGTIRSWHNLAAEDDYLCHDKTVADDFAALVNAELVDEVVDHTMYNLAVRNGVSNPHSSVGYLLHPRTIELLGRFLDGEN